MANVQIHGVVLADPTVLVSNSTGELKPFSIQLSAKGRDLELRLTPSRFNKLVEKHNFSENQGVRLYQGDVSGDAGSWARISLDNGTLSGTVYHYGTFHQLESRAVAQTTLNSHNESNQGTVVDNGTNHDLVFIEPVNASDSQQLANSFFSGTDFQLFPPPYAQSDDRTFDSNKIRRSAIITKDGLGTSVTRAIRVGIVVDSAFNEVHKGRGLARALGIINSVDAIYQTQLGIAIIVEGIRVYTDPNTDPMRNNGETVPDILANFRDVRLADKRLAADLTAVHLFSGHRDPNRMIGLGWIGTACRVDGFDISMSTPFPFDTLLAAHEIAHNLGALHDDDSQCLIDGNTKAETIMWPEITGSSTSTFSACSTEAIQHAKNATCNLDDIDVSVRLNTIPNGRTLSRSVIIEANNKDRYGRATELATTTEFPAGTKFTNVGAGCLFAGLIVNCNHGRLQAGSTHTASVTATLPRLSVSDVITNIEQINANDSKVQDNRAAIQLLQVDNSTGEPVSASSQLVVFDDSGTVATTANATAGTPSVGSVSISLLMLLLSVLFRAGTQLLRVTA